MFLISCGFLTNLAEYKEASTNQAGIVDKIILVLNSTPRFIWLLLPAYIFYLKKVFLKIKARSIIWVVFSCVIALAIILSSALSQVSELGVLYSSKTGFILSAICFLTISFIIYSFVMPTAHYLHSIKTGPIKCFVLNKWIIATILIICWLPYVIAFAPGTPSPDIASQLLQFEGVNSFTNHYPILSTFIYGAFFSLGSAIGGSSSHGLFLITLAHLGALVSAITYETSVLKQLRAPFGYIVGSICFYAIVPIFGLFCQWAVKDTLFAVAFTFYTTIFIQLVICLNNGSFPKKLFIALIVSAFFVGILRHNGFFVILLSLPFVAVFYKGFKNRLLYLCAIALVIVSIPVSNNIALLAVDGKPGSVKEALSIPMQQTARYVVKHGDDVLDWEKEAIDSVMDFESLAARYRPQVADGVKGDFDPNNGLLNYLAAWINQGLRHPLTYIEATLIQTYGYWTIQDHLTYPQEYPSTAYSSDMEYFEYDAESEKFGWGPWTSSNVRESVRNYISIIRSVPLFNFLSQIGFYTWLMLFELALFLSSHKFKFLIILLPCIILLLTCIAGPLNGSLRYAFGIIAVAPIQLWSSLAACSHQTKSSAK